MPYMELMPGLLRRSWINLETFSWIRLRGRSLCLLLVSMGTISPCLAQQSAIAKQEESEHDRYYDMPSYLRAVTRPDKAARTSRLVPSTDLGDETAPSIGRTVAVLVSSQTGRTAGGDGPYYAMRSYNSGWKIRAPAEPSTYTLMRNSDNYEGELLGAAIGAGVGAIVSLAVSTHSIGSGGVHPLFVLGGAIIGLGIGSRF